MKKIVLALAVVFSVALVSCGNKNAENADSDTVVEVAVEEATDSLGDSVADTAAVVEVAEEVAPAQ